MKMKTTVFGPGLPDGAVLKRDDYHTNFLESKLDDGPHSFELADGGTYTYVGGAGCGVTFVQAPFEESFVPQKVR